TMSGLEIGKIATGVLLSAAILTAAFIYKHEVEQDRLQRQCMLFVEAFGTERLGIMFSVTKPELDMPAAVEGRNAAKSVANFVKLTPEHEAYCDTRPLSYPARPPTN